MQMWQTKEQLKNLVKELVNVQSMTFTPGEVYMADFLKAKLQTLPYFKENKDHLRLHGLEDGRKLVTAFVRTAESKETIILLSHFDVVHIDDYGDLKPFAFETDLLTEKIRALQDLRADVKADIEDGDWLFGRGTMDMKAGIALHLSLLERASSGELNANLLMISVPDEEANSAGMLCGVQVLNELSRDYNIDYKACLNGEPSFTSHPGDNHHYVYTGSIGKLLAGYLCYGKETHVGEPFAGVSGNLLAAEVTRSLEWNTDFIDNQDGEIMPPPSNLLQKDLKDHYSVQIPHAAVTLFNVMLMEKPLQQLTEELLSAGQTAAEQLHRLMESRLKSYEVISNISIPVPTISVMTFQQLCEYAITKHGQSEVKRIQNEVLAKKLGDERETAIQYVNEIAGLCRNLAPMIILFYAPPFYPAVHTSESPLIKHALDEITKNRSTVNERKLWKKSYFNGLSDLSYIGFQYSEEDLEAFSNNFPLLEKIYPFPIEAMKQLNIPVLNIGPFGKDAHQWTERLDLATLTTARDMAEQAINAMMAFKH
ncbi:M20/M25/M40 family metallo-hydrolase [Fictibacillus iocasae]|uniref:M20/M25/M40 family metallo-hydrolase n=1 Tax=Fictibacillus iocasae TaxID=2715437 RepID=A0ABW2NQF5_9BACL